MALAPITGAVLDWALADAGIDAGSLAGQLGTSESTVRSWISDEQRPTIGQLDKVARLLHRPRSFFFLAEPPARQPVRTQFRTYENSASEPGHETLAGIQLARRIQKTTAWVRQRINETDRVSIPPPVQPIDYERYAQVLREWLGWNTLFQRSPIATDVKVTQSFREAIQEQGIVVLHLTLDEDRTRGFSLWDPTAPLLAVNRREGYRARLFSYGHELAHLALGRTAVCSVKGANSGLERTCNQIAAALLTPEDAFRAVVRERTKSGRVDTLDEVGSIRNRFHVSMRAVAIRAESLGLATAGLYERVDNEAEYRPGRRGGSYTPGNERTKPVIRIDEYGREFVNTLVRAENAQILRRRQVAELLRVSDQELAQMQMLTFTGTDA